MGVTEQRRTARAAMAAVLAVVLAMGALGADVAGAAKPTSPGGGNGGGGGDGGGGDDGESSGTDKVPSSFLARVHADALGRIPLQADWNQLTDQFATSGCDASTLGSFARGVYTGTEFASLYADDAPRLYTLYRGVLSREPLRREFEEQLKHLAAGRKSWSQIVDGMVSGSEFASKATEICDPSRASYGYGGDPYAYGGTYSASTLQSALDEAGRAGGGVVTVPRHALVALSAPLDVPYGVTLRTEGVAGIDGLRAYATMARFVRADGYTGDMLNVWAGAQVHNVWVDGLKAQNPDTHGGVNFLLRPPKSDQGASSLRWSRGDNPLGAQNVRVFGREVADDVLSGNCAGGVVVEENLLGQWANDNRRAGSHWADGIGSACSHTTIRGNEVLDGSDVPIILWRSDSQDAQQSLVDSNRILNAGNDAFAALAADPGSTTWYTQAGESTEWTTATFSNNVIWTGQQVHYVLGLSLGTRAWSYLSPWAYGTGGTFSGNGSGESRVRVQLAGYASGLYEATATNNWTSALVDMVASGDSGHGPDNSCGVGWLLRNPDASSGTLDGFSDGTRDGCI